MFNGVDYIILAVVTLSALIGLWRGFIKEVFALLNWILAILLSYLFYQQLGEILPIGQSSQLIREGLSAVLIFVCVLIAGAIITSLLTGLVQAAGLSGTDRVLGLLFGFFRAAIIVLALLVFLPTVVAPIAEQSWWINSHLIPIFLEFEEWAKALYESLSRWIGGLLGGES